MRWIAGVMMSAALLVLPQGNVHEVQVAPAAPSVAVGATSKLHATAYDAAGNVIPSGVRYRWVSNNVNVARVDSLGNVTAVAPGTALVKAEAIGSDKNGTATVTVRRAS